MVNYTSSWKDHNYVHFFFTMFAMKTYTPIRHNVPTIVLKDYWRSIKSSEKAEEKLIIIIIIIIIIFRTSNLNDADSMPISLLFIVKALEYIFLKKKL